MTPIEQASPSLPYPLEQEPPRAENRSCLCRLIYKIGALIGRIFDALYHLFPGKAGETFRENSRLLEEIKVIKIENFKLSNDLPFFKSAYAIAQTINDGLNKEKATLDTRVEELTREKEDFQKKYQDEHKQRVSLLEKNSELSKKITRRDTKIINRNEEIARLKQEAEQKEKELREKVRTTYHQHRTSNSAELPIFMRTVSGILPQFSSTLFQDASAPPQTVVVRGRTGSYAPPVSQIDYNG